MTPYQQAVQKKNMKTSEVDIFKSTMNTLARGSAKSSFDQYGTLEKANRLNPST